MEELIKKAARDLVNSKYAIALTGAGISTESGIPDFRGPSGVWTKDPAAERRSYQTYPEFLQDPKKWWQERLANAYASPLGNLERMTPNRGHYALVELEKLDVLKYVITQNVDALHERAGSQHLLEYHGSFAKLRCLTCGSRLRREEVDLEKLLREDKLPPRCPRCRGAMKTDTVFFGEPIPDDVARLSIEEAQKCDLLLICGTSAVVFPFASLPRLAKQKAPEAKVIEVNAEPTPLTSEGISDYLIQGKTGDILPKMVEEIKRIRA